jgi:hypothetical protein
MATKWINNFTGGEWSPYLDGRTDLEKYNSACRTMQNMRPLPYGGAKIRGGLKYVAEVSTSALPTRLIPFNFSTGTRFVIELGDYTMRFFSNGAQVLSGGLPYEIATPWDSGRVFPLQFKQINDIIYFTHPYEEPQTLSRIADDNWTLAPTVWTYPPMREENTSAITMTPSGTTGSITLTASSAYFNADMVGAYFEIRHLREAGAVDVAISGSSGTTTSSSLSIQGNWTVVTTERWYGTLEVQRSEDGGTSWQTIRKFLSSADRNVSASGTQSRSALLRLNYTSDGDPYGAVTWAGTAPTDYVFATAKLESEEAYVTGLVKVTAFTDTTHVTATVVDTILSATATDIWSEGAWSPYRGYPRCLGLYEQRLYYAGTFEKPIRFWGSTTGDFLNFRYSDSDDAAVAFDIASTESSPINWIEALQRIVLGSSGGEFTAQAGSLEEPLTPSNISVKGQSSYGSELYQPVVVNDVVVFLQRGARKIREMSFDLGRDGYVSPDLTLLAEHITTGGVVQLGLAKNMDTTIFAACGSGELAVLTYNREQNVTAWARYVTDGRIESVACIYGTTNDEVWVVVLRTIMGQEVRSVEYFTVETDVKEDATYLDAHITGTLSGTFSGVIGGLIHLEGETVTLVVAGAKIGEYVVDGFGQITVDPLDVPTLGKYCVGLPYRAAIQPMKMDTVSTDGPSQGKTRRISEVSVRFKSSIGCKVGPSLAKLETIPFRSTLDVMDASPDEFTGDKKVAYNGVNDKSADLWIVQDDPLPFTCLGIAVKYEFFN